MNPLAISAALVAFCAGFWIDHQLMSAKITESQNQALRAKQDFVAHYLDAKKAADADKQAIEQRANTALEKARNVKQAPLVCPASGDLFDAVIPGLSDSLRDIQSSGISGPAAPVGRVPLNHNSL